MRTSINGTWLWRGLSLLVVGIALAAIGIAGDTMSVGGFRLTLYGYGAVFGGLGFVGAAFVPAVVTFFGGKGATWEDLSLLQQSLVSFLIAVGLVVLLLLFVSLIAPL